MPRLIDADAFDKVLRDAQLECKKNGGNFRYGVLATVRANLEKAPTVSGWVSVKDRLPSYAELHCEEVLVLHENGSIFLIGFDECIEGESIFGEWEQGFDPISLGATESYWVPLDGVMYWMPLPEPPEVKDEV